MFQKVSFKLLLGLLFGVLSPIFALSQNATPGFECGGVTQIGGNVPIGGHCTDPIEGTFDEMKFYEKNNFIPHNPAITPIKPIRVSVTCIYDPTAAPFSPQRGFDGSPGQKEWFQEVFRKINGLFDSNPPPSDPIVPEHITDTRIRFVLENIQFVKAVDLADMTTDAGLLVDKAAYAYKRAEVINVIVNLYKIPTNPTATAHALSDLSFGLASQPAAQMCKPVYQEKYLGVGKCHLTPNVADYSDDCVTQTGVVQITFAHELGHLLGLNHTYEGGGASAYCGPDFQNQDFYADLCLLPNDDFECPHPGGWDTPYTGPGGATNDLMGGTNSAGYLSPQQQGMMHRHLCNSSMRNYVKGSPYSAVPDPTFVVTGNETWTNNTRVYNDVIVKPGAMLTVKCEIHFSDGARFIVERGGKLVLDGGLLTNTSGGLWNGVEVWGDETKVPAYNTQGTCQIINGGTIENAVVGLWSGRGTIALPGGVAQIVPGYGGGILEIDNGIFRNNYFGVRFNDYKPGLWSFIKNSTFVCSTWLKGQAIDFGTSVMVAVGGVSGTLPIDNCTFTNTLTVNANFSIGVSGVDTGFDLSRSTFNGLKRGVLATNTGMADFSIGKTVYKCKFINVTEEGIRAVGLSPSGSAITGSDFDVRENEFSLVDNGGGPPIPYPLLKRGFSFQGYTGVNVESNHIYNAKIGLEFRDVNGTGGYINEYPASVTKNDFRYNKTGVNTAGRVSFESFTCNRFRDYSSLELSLPYAMTNSGAITDFLTGAFAIGSNEASVANFFEGGSGQIDILNGGSGFSYLSRKANNGGGLCGAPNIIPSQLYFPNPVVVVQVQGQPCNYNSYECKQSNNGGGGPPNGIVNCNGLNGWLNALSNENDKAKRKGLIRKVAVCLKQNNNLTGLTTFLQQTPDSIAKGMLLREYLAANQYSQAEALIEAMPENNINALYTKDYFRIICDYKKNDKRIAQADSVTMTKIRLIAKSGSEAKHGARAFWYGFDGTLAHDAEDAYIDSLAGISYRLASETGGGAYISKMIIM